MGCDTDRMREFTQPCYVSWRRYSGRELQAPTTTPGAPSSGADVSNPFHLS